MAWAASCTTRLVANASAMPKVVQKEKTLPSSSHAGRETLHQADAMLMGRVLYEEWAAYWPQQDPEENPVAAQMNGIQKYVVSTTLEEPLEWNNSTLIN